MGDVGVVILKSLRRLIKSSRAKVGVVNDRSSKYPVLSNQLYQSWTPEVDRGVWRVLSENVFTLSQPTTASKYVDEYKEGA